MNLVNKKVIHKTFGEGNVVNYDDSYIIIHFASGPKRFVFPDVFGEYVTLVDQSAANIIRKMIQIKEEQRKKEAQKRKKEQDLKRERLYVLEQKREQNKPQNKRKIHPELQLAFWCKAEEEDKIFTDWKVFIGKVKTGKSKGQIRRLTRVNQNSACLITRREPRQPEEDRVILGVFLAEEAFDGRDCEDGYISAHPKYRMLLTEREAEKMLFWNYYVNKRFPNSMTWNSGRQRYMDNRWMAQVLRDIISLKEKPQERKAAQLFFEHFCKINRISKEELPEANGALKRS